MKIFIGYDELSNHIKDRFNQDITFLYVSDKNMKASYTKKALMVAIPMSVDLSLTGINADSISVKYHAFVGIDQIISMALKMIVSRHPDLKNAFHIKDDICTVNLAEMKNARAFTHNFAIEDINLSKEGINVSVSFKKTDRLQNVECQETANVEAIQKESELMQSQPAEKDRSKWIASFKNTLKTYADKFTPKDFIDKISRSGKEMGVKLVYSALILFYALIDGKVPIKDKLIVTAALGYVVLPIDIIPDVLVGGFIDDASIVAFALKTIRDDITPEIKAQAFKKLQDYFKVEKAPDLFF